MARQVYKDAVVTIAATGYGAGASNEIVSGFSLVENVEQLDTTVFSGAVRKREGGLKDGTVTFTFKPMTDLSDVTTINALLGTDVAITIKPDNAAISTANPELQFNVLVTEGIPIGGDVGSLQESSVTWPLTTAVTYDTTP